MQTFFFAFKGSMMGWYDSSRVRGGQDFQVDTEAEIKWDYRGTSGSTSMSLILCQDRLEGEHELYYLCIYMSAGAKTIGQTS